MIKTLILVCNLSTPASDCTKANALDVLRGETVGLPQRCLLDGETRAAEVADQLGFDPSREYVKIRCERVRERRGADAAVPQTAGRD